MRLRRLLLRIPVINIFYFACCPKTAYMEYLEWIMEENDITMEQLWKQLKIDEKRTLVEFGVQPPVENISGNIKEDARDSTEQPDRHNQEEASD